MCQGAGQRLVILGVGVDPIGQAEALARIEGFIGGGQSHQVVTVNPELIIAAQSDEEFRRLLNAAHLSLPDGVGLLWAARRLGQPLPERVTGVDTFRRLASLAAERGYSLFLLGGGPGVAEEAAARLQRVHPALRIVGTHAGSPAPQEEDYIVGLIRRQRPDMLFVAFGSPAQEKWIHRNLGRLGVTVAMGVGGAYDFVAGRVPRAPQAMQRAGLEWLYRLYRQPWRWRRMLALPQFAWLVVREARRPGA